MRWKGPLSPAASAVRSLGPRNRGARHHHPASLDEPRSTRCPPPGTAPFQDGPPVRQTLPRTLEPRTLALTNARDLVLADPEVSLRAGPPSLVTCKISSVAARAAQGLDGAVFKILSDGLDHPQDQARYPQATACCPPVVHRFIHRRTHPPGHGHDAPDRDRRTSAGPPAAGGAGRQWFIEPLPAGPYEDPRWSVPPADSTSTARRAASCPGRRPRPRPCRR